MLTWCDACDGSQAGSHPDGDSEAKEFCGLQAVECDGWCELRTRNRALSLANYRAGPPYQYSPRKDPDLLNVKSIALAVLTSISDQFHLLLLSATLRRR